MGDRAPFSTLLSQALVAFTIELDNEFEHQLLATAYRPFLVSMVMWCNFLRFVPAEGIKARELAATAGYSKPVHPSQPGMERWGYVKVERDPNDERAKPPKGDLVVRCGLTGQKALEIWEPLPTEIEARWRERLGPDAVDALTASLEGVVSEIDLELPAYLPVLGSKGLFATWDERERDGSQESLPLYTLFSRALLAFTLDFEHDFELSLPLGANVVRVLDEEGTPVRDLPDLSGVSKEAISMAMTYLENNGLVTLDTDPEKKRTKLVRLTPEGRKAQAAHHDRLDEVEKDWTSRFGGDTIDALRGALEGVVGHERFAEGLVPPPTGWRAKKPYRKRTEAFTERPREALPHHPMVLHRGGWPDGS